MTARLQYPAWKPLLNQSSATYSRDSLIYQDWCEGRSRGWIAIKYGVKATAVQHIVLSYAQHLRSEARHAS